jgi:hypothetical protein
MSMPVEVRLRVPNMKVRALDENGYPIDHASMRFRKVIEVPKIPKPDEMLDLSTSSGRHCRHVLFALTGMKGSGCSCCRANMRTDRSRRRSTERWRLILRGS